LPPGRRGLPSPGRRPLPLLPPSAAAASRGRRAKPGRCRRRRPAFPRVVEKRVGALLVHGGGAPQGTPVRRSWETVVRRRCAVAELHDALVAASGRLAQIRASWASDGLGRARSLRFAVLSVGGCDGSARVGTPAAPACCNRAVGALRARPGQRGPGVSRCSVQSMTAARRWRWAPPARL
jgi:hypothetical protein